MRVNRYIVGIIVDFLITVVIITSPASLILQKRLRRRDSIIISDITFLVIGNQPIVLLIWYLTCMNRLLLPEIPELYGIKDFQAVDYALLS